MDVRCGAQGFLDNAAMGRLSVAEALTNMSMARISEWKNVKASGNWMWAAKMEGEGALMYDCAIAMRDIMLTVGMAIDGGKDSLSMAATADSEVVKTPGSLVISAYCDMPDITKTVTPDLKLGDDGRIIHVDLAAGKRRTGGSALAQVCPSTSTHSSAPRLQSSARCTGNMFCTLEEIVQGPRSPRSKV
jgi:phosphoribosylformylglycinamidine synthase